MNANQSHSSKMLEVAQYIEDKAADVLNLELLAEQFDMSPFYLQRKFKTEMGVSPKQLQNAIRIQRLKQALKDQDDVSGAIYEAGFGSASRVYEQVNKSLGMTPSSYKAGGKNKEITFALRKTSFGHIIMAATTRGVCFVHFGESFAELVQALSEEFPHASITSTPECMTNELDLWIAALELHVTQNGPKPEVPLHIHGTAFQLKVWQFLTSIKEGEQVTYKDVAEGIDAPTSFRAAANACGKNNVAILVPCHRVLRGDGGLGGYRWGEERKKSLLAMES